MYCIGHKLTAAVLTFFLIAEDTAFPVSARTFVSTQEITAVEIIDASLVFYAGDTPHFTACSGDPLRYSISYERWCDAFDYSRFITSDPDMNDAMGLTADNCLTEFLDGGQYHYDFLVTANSGYTFADDVEVSLNGIPCTVYGHSADMIPVNDAYVLNVTMPDTTTTTTTTTAFTEPYAPDLLYGDMNQDGRLSAADAVLLLRYVTEDRIFTFSEVALHAADIVPDGIIDLKDVSELLTVISGQSAGDTVKPMPAESDTEPVTLSGEAAAEWNIPSDGSSAAFTIQPLDGLTVSAEANALSYDGQLQISEPTDEQGRRMTAYASAHGGFILDGWQIEAGLSSDGHLPGNYTVEYDLSTLDLPESDCCTVIPVRMDDSGNVFEYAAERNGNILRWESDQNSLVMLLGLTTLSCLAYYAKKERIDPEIKERECWTEREKESLRQYKTNYCTIMYSDFEDADVRDARRQKMKEIEDAAVKEAETAVQDDWIPWAEGSWAYNRAVGRKTAELLSAKLESDAEYRECVDIENGIPADVLLLASYYETAQNYLHFHEDCPYLGYKPALIYSEGVADEGSAVTPVWLASYIQIRRDNLDSIRRVPKNTSADDIYEQDVSASIADKMLITLTHEMFHLIQNKVYSSHVSENLKFSELSAMCVEHRAGAYFAEYGRIKSYSEVISKTYETYKLALEDHSCSSETAQSHVINQGYALSLFWEFLSEQKKIRYSGWKMLKAYQAAGNMTNTFIKAFGLSDDTDNTTGNDLSTYWKAFQQSVSKDAYTQAKDLFGKTEDKDGYFPSLLKKLRVFENHTSAHSAIKNADYSCTLVALKGTEKGAWSAVLVRDPNFGELLPHTAFMLPNDANGVPVGAESKNGLVLTTDQQFIYYRERQDGGNLGASGYQLHFIPAPQTPDVRIDTEADSLRIRLQSEQSPEGAKGLTDRFLLCFTLNGREVLTQPVEFADREKEIIVPLSELGCSLNMRNDLQITVCEQIDANDEFPACRTAASEPFAIQLGNAELPELDTDISGAGTYGTVGVSGLNGHFTLDRSGQFTLGFSDASYAPSGNPFADEPLGTWECTGFTVSGTFGTNMDNPNDFTAKLTGCSADTFSAQKEKPVFQSIENDSDITVLSDTVTCSGTGLNTGTLRYQLDPETKKVTLTLTIQTEMHCVETIVTERDCADTYETDTNENVLTENAIQLQFHFIMP